MVGTAPKKVTRCRPMASRVRAGSKLSRSTTVPPWNRTGTLRMLSPRERKRGAGINTTSSSLNSKKLRAFKLL